MSGLTGLRVASRLLLVAVLVGSGGYVLVYLYRWEWNRALMAGVFFVAAEIALIGAAILNRLQSMENRDRRLAPTSVPGDRAASAPGAAPPPARGPFAWLEETSGGFGVFIPILLGAGVLLSMIAWVVERLARFVTAPVVGSGQASPFSSIDLPSGGLLPGTAEAPVGAHDPLSGSPVGHGLGSLEAPGRSLQRTAVHWAVTLGAIGVLLGGIWFLREAAESRPGGGGTGTTTVELEISTREMGASTDQLVDALWVACRLRLPRDAELVSAEVPEPGSAVITVAPGLGETDRRQFTGCLGDTVLDRVDADVTRVETTTDPVAPVA